MSGIEKYRIRKRYLYVLIFKKSNRCYVGQSVNPKRRDRQHAQTWGKEKYTMFILNAIYGNYADAEEFEYAWRYKAYQKGIDVYGLPGIIVKPQNRMTPERQAIAKKLKWPRYAKRGGKFKRFMFQACILMGVVFVAFLFQYFYLNNYFLR